MKLKQLLAMIIVGLLAAMVIVIAVSAQGRKVRSSVEVETIGQIRSARQLNGIEAANWLATAQAPNDLVLLYRFTGVTDDGDQGSGSRTIATAIHCTNWSSNLNEISVAVYQWTAEEVYTATMNVLTNQTVTFSTQETEVYSREILLGGGSGTMVIDQGSGEIYAEHSQVICTVQAVDPLNNPPEFISNLQLFRD